MTDQDLRRTSLGETRIERARSRFNEKELEVIKNCGEIVSVKFSKPSLSKKDEEQTKELTFSTGASEKALKVMKHILGGTDKQPESFREYVKYEGRARRLWADMTLAIGEQGRRLLPRAKRKVFMEEFAELKRMANSYLEEFIRGWDDIVEHAKTHLGNTYNADDYCTADQMRSMFRFEYKMDLLASGAELVDKLGSHIPTDTMALIQDQRDMQFAETVRIAERDAHQRLILAPMEKIFVALGKDGSAGRIQERTFESLAEVIQNLRDYRITGDEDEYNQVANALNDWLGEFELGAIREDKGKREEAEDKLAQVIGSTKSLLHAIDRG